MGSIMHSPKVHLLFVYFLIGIFSIAQAQLPVRGTRWKGVLLAPTNGQVTMTFQWDTLLVLPEGTSVVPEILRYQQTGDTLLLQKITGQSPCNSNVTGLYKLVYTNNGENLALQAISDGCHERQKMLTSKAPFVRQRSSHNQPPRNWPYLDPAADSIAGISLYRAYELLKNRTPVPVIVGVLDSGVDITQEDLRDVIWVNPSERPNNQIDDDKNGYTDDLNGWNFMGAKDGTTYEYDQPEITQTYVLLRNKYDKANPATLSPSEKRQYDTYQTAKKQFMKHYAADQPKRLAFADTVKFWTVARQIREKLPDSTTSQSAIRQVDLGTDSVAIAVRTILADGYFPQYGPFSYYATLVRQNWARFRQIMGSEAIIAYNPAYNARTSVGDNPGDLTERDYGSPRMIIGQSQQLAMHGSHVAGIIAAKRGNGRGIDGVADNVWIMPVSVVPANGDERDKDVANGIRYAVENGAKVINMSFGKRLSPFKEQVDAAIRFAEEHDVLIVHAAGNGRSAHHVLQQIGLLHQLVP